jgi:hypothetical protein
MLCVTGSTASAQTAPRIKAVVQSSDSNSVTVLAQGDTAPMKIGIRPATRIMKEEPRSLDAIKAGDYIGATLIPVETGAKGAPAKDGKSALAAQEVHIFPKVLEGSGEGLYPATPGSSILIVSGTVSAAGPAALSVRFRGATGDGATCTGRANVNNPIVGCKGEVSFAVAANVPVLALVTGDKSGIVPGAVLAISLIAGPDGKPVSAKAAPKPKARTDALGPKPPAGAP